MDSGCAQKVMNRLVLSPISISWFRVAMHCGLLISGQTNRFFNFTSHRERERSYPILLKGCSSCGIAPKEEIIRSLFCCSSWASWASAFSLSLIYILVFDMIVISHGNSQFEHVNEKSRITFFASKLFCSCNALSCTQQTQEIHMNRNGFVCSQLHNARQTSHLGWHESLRQSRPIENPKRNKGWQGTY